MKASELIIYSDVDGTLRSFNDDWDFINKKDKKAIEEFIANGGCFSVATGRGINDISNNIVSLCNMPLVLLQGSYVYDHINKKEISNNSIDSSIKNIMLDYAKKDKDVVLIFSSYEKKYVVELDGNRPKPLGGTYYQCDEKFYLSEEAITIELDSNEEHAKEIHKRLLAMKLKYMNVVASASVCVEIFKEHCYKSYGVKMAIDYMKNFDNSLESRKVACIGDYYNDIEMLKSADISGTPKDSLDDIKKICSVITCSTEDGAVADFINHCLSL